MTLRFEIHVRDTKQVWMEVLAEYILPFHDTNDLDDVEANIRETYRFLAEKAKDFLDQFDHPDEDGEAS